MWMNDTQSSEISLFMINCKTEGRVSSLALEKYGFDFLVCFAMLITEILIMVTFFPFNEIFIKIPVTEG